MYKLDLGHVLYCWVNKCVTLHNKRSNDANVNIYKRVTGVQIYLNLKEIRNSAPNALEQNHKNRLIRSDLTGKPVKRL